MISEVDAVLRSLLAPTGAQLRFDLPGTDRPDLPVVSLLLHGVYEDVDARLSGWLDDRDEHGRVIARRPSLRHYRLDYLLTVWAADVAAEHALFDEVLSTLADIEAVPVEHLANGMRDVEGPLLLAVGRPAASTVPSWAELGITARPVLTVRATTALVRPAVAVPDAPRTIDLGVANEPPPRPIPAPARPGPARRVREPAEQGRS